MKSKQISIVLLAIWWGAFTFYAGIVIPLGMKVLGSHTQMGFITQEVTTYINYCSLPIFLFLLYAFRDAKWFLIPVCLLILLQIMLFVLHQKLHYMLDYQTLTVKLKAEFYSLHRIYLLISTLIWLIVSALMAMYMRN